MVWYYLRYEYLGKAAARLEEVLTVVPDKLIISSRRRHTRFDCDWSSDVCSSDLGSGRPPACARGSFSRPPARRARPESFAPHRRRPPWARAAIRYASFGGTPGTGAGRLRSCAACAGTRPARPGGTSGKTGPLHPCGKVLQGALSDPALPLLLVADAGRERRKEAVVGVHRLEVPRVAGRDVLEQRAVRGRLRRDHELLSLQAAGGVNAGQPAGGGGLGVAFDPDELASQKDPSGALQLQRVPEQRRRSEEHTSELQSQSNLVCRLLLEKKKKYKGRYVQ